MPCRTRRGVPCPSHDPDLPPILRRNLRDPRAPVPRFDLDEEWERWTPAQRAAWARLDAADQLDDQRPLPLTFVAGYREGASRGGPAAADVREVLARLGGVVPPAGYYEAAGLAGARP